jgi:hypothetical protein
LLALVWYSQLVEIRLVEKKLASQQVLQTDENLIRRTYLVVWRQVSLACLAMPPSALKNLFWCQQREHGCTAIVGCKNLCVP